MKNKPRFITVTQCLLLLLFGAVVQQQQQQHAGSSIRVVAAAFTTTSPQQTKKNKASSPSVVMEAEATIANDGTVTTTSSSSSSSSSPTSSFLQNQGFEQDDDPRVRFCARLFESLYQRYRERVEHVRVYEELLEKMEQQQQKAADQKKNNGKNTSTDPAVTKTMTKMVVDHIAFRTFASSTHGIASLSRLFEALGYKASGVYDFPKKKLSAIHYQHSTNAKLPKLFLSELKVWEFENKEFRDIIVDGALKSHKPLLPPKILAALRFMGHSHSHRHDDNQKEKEEEELLNIVLNYIETLPWDIPTRSQVELLHEHSQYAAWVLLHGYKVNHFAALVNPEDDEVDHAGGHISRRPLNSLIDTVHAMQAAGVPMKEHIEGAVGSKLRQSATQSVTMNVPIGLDDDNDQGESRSTTSTTTTMPWNYAYVEFAERGTILADEYEDDGIRKKSERFQGFLGPQATELFEMTRAAV